VIITRDVTEPATIRIRRMQISYEKSVGCGCGFVARLKFVSASYYSYDTAIQISNFCVHL